RVPSWSDGDRFHPSRAPFARLTRKAHRLDLVEQVCRVEDGDRLARIRPDEVGDARIVALDFDDDSSLIRIANRLDSIEEQRDGPLCVTNHEGRGGIARAYFETEELGERGDGHQGTTKCKQTAHARMRHRDG